METNLALSYFTEKIVNGQPFTFIRFSDGETEILQKRKLVLSSDGIHYKGMKIKYNYSEHDKKTFIPENNDLLIKDLWSSLKHTDDDYFIGIPWMHNLREDHEWYKNQLNHDLVINADIFVNSNYKYFRNEFMKKVLTKSDVYVIANHRACDVERIFSGIIPMQDDFFLSYESVMNQAFQNLRTLPKFSIVLASASSMSNVLAYKLKKIRNDITFIDCGTAINYLLGLGNSRVYHWMAFGPKNFKQLKMCVQHLLTGKYFMK